MWSYRLPRAARIAITAALMFVAMFGVLQLQTFDAGGSLSASTLIVEALLCAVIGLIAGVVAVPLGEQHVRRIFGSFEQCNAYWRALRTGELPAHIDPAVWRGWLSVSRKSMRWWPISIAVFVVIGVMQILNHDWGLAVLSAVLLIWYGICGPVQKGRISRLTVAVEQRTTAAAHAD